jgi:hypothetical protein
MTDLGPLSEPPRRHRWDDGWVGRAIKLVGVTGILAAASFWWKGCNAISDAQATMTGHTLKIAELERREEQTGLSVAYIRGILDERASVAEKAAGVQAEAKARDDMNRAKTRPLPGAP